MPRARVSIPGWGANKPPFMHKHVRQGGCGRGSCTRCPVRPERGQRGKEWVRTFVRRATFPVCAQRRGGATPAQKGEEWRTPRLAHVAHRTGGYRWSHKWGHTARGGGGTQTVFTSPLPSLNPRSHAALCAGRGGRQRVDEGGRSRESCFPRRLDTRRHVTAVFGLQSRDLGT